ncbi:G1 family glutamic endopeptidase, partial [Arthrobacter livingstonensis]
MNADQPAAPQVPYQLVPTNVPGAWVSAWPPEGFDPNVEGAAARARAGMPWRRPDASDPQGLRTAWERAFSHPWPTAGLIVPRLEPQPGVTHNVRGLKKASDGSFTSNNWAGGVVAGTWTGAIGYWHIPTVIAPAEPQGSEGGWNSSSWVGLDGTYGSNDVLQAGVQQRVDSGDNASYVAWYEWFAPQQPTSPGYIFQTNIPNFSVSPGDTVYCSVQYGAGSAQVSFGNEANGEHFSITLAPPPGATFNGNCAEWIMEAPDGGETTASLPSFTPVAFTSAVCCGPNKSSSNPLNGDTWNIVAFGTTLTSVALATDAVTISYAGPTFWVDDDLTNFSSGVPAVGGSALDGYWGSDS